MIVARGVKVTAGPYPYRQVSTTSRRRGAVAAVRVTPVTKQFAKVLKTSDGSETVLITGRQRLSFTNLSTGKTITENASASSTFTANADGSVTVASRGRSPLVLAPADAQRFGLPGVSVVAGRVTESVDSAGNLSLSLHGHVAVDVCAALS